RTCCIHASISSTGSHATVRTWALRLALLSSSPIVVVPSLVGHRLAPAWRARSGSPARRELGPRWSRYPPGYAAGARACRDPGARGRAASAAEWSWVYEPLLVVGHTAPR